MTVCPQIYFVVGNRWPTVSPRPWTACRKSAVWNPARQVLPPRYDAGSWVLTSWPWTTTSAAPRPSRRCRDSPPANGRNHRRHPKPGLLCLHTIWERSPFHICFSALQLYAPRPCRPRGRNRAARSSRNILKHAYHPRPACRMRDYSVDGILPLFRPEQPFATEFRRLHSNMDKVIRSFLLAEP